MKWNNLFKVKIDDLLNDPLIGCYLYEDLGCAHIDGYLCDYPNCSMLKEHIEKRKKTIDRKNKLKKLMKNEI